ncbi:3626_t:CDS:2 [Paraglomus occultum]|uniref:3626_t:CDS:1 n=1 Tax=Paraglomus occultum TaxID=144539 RepID=A0A9N8VTS0_9GLOM|nr:3626_t:CDS:2 [Paraglomus occultum]
MLFELNNTNTQRHSHAGVLEFIAEEGRAYLPHWMMQTLLLEPGDLLEIKNADLQLGSYVKIQPQTPDFLDISDPKAVLENALRNFSTLTKGDVIQISYNEKIYEIMVLEVRSKPDLYQEHPPSDGVSIVETDLEVDFAPPLGYVEPKPLPKRQQTMADKVKIEYTPTTTRTLFHGSGQRLNGKAVKEGEADSTVKSTEKSVPPALNLPFGKLFFGYKLIPLSDEKMTNANEGNDKSFAGSGQTLRTRKRNQDRTPSTSSAIASSSSS